MPASSHLHAVLPMPGKEKRAVLHDAWEQCEGEWKRSALYKRFAEKNTTTQHGARVWLTRSQVARKYESQSMADKICNAKLQDAETKEKTARSTRTVRVTRLGKLWCCWGLELTIYLFGSIYACMHAFAAMIVVISLYLLNAKGYSYFKMICT